MSRRKLDSLKAYSTSLKKGFGIGEGARYKPWLRVQDVGSTGKSAVLKGFKSERKHHLLSSGEKQFFLLAEFSPSVIDIREQFPLFPLDTIHQLSRELNIKYPKVPTTGAINVQTTDFVLTVRKQGSDIDEYLAVSVKTEKELSKFRTLEKLELERVWWTLVGVPYRIFVASEATAFQAVDIEWLTGPLRFGYMPTKTQMEWANELVRPGTYFIADLVEQIVVEMGLSQDQALMLLRTNLVERAPFIDLRTSILKTNLVSIRALGRY